MPQTNNDQFGAWMSTALVIGTMVGAGIFMLPISLAPLGWNAVIAWFICGIGAVSLAIGLAQISQNGSGMQAEISHILGYNAGFLAAWAYWTSTIASNAAVAIAATSAISRLGMGHDMALAVGFIVVFTAINIAATRAAGALQLLTVAIKLLPIAAVILLVIFLSVKNAPLNSLAPSPITIPNIAQAVALTVFALLGFENLTMLVDKIRDPLRNLPRAIVGGTAFVALLYLLSSSSVSLLLSPAKASASSAPYVDAISTSLAPWVGATALFCIIISSLGTLSGGMLSTGESAYSMGLRGDLPQIFARTRAANIPYASHLISAALAILLVLANSSRSLNALFVFTILLTSAGIMVFYIIGSCAAMKRAHSLKSRTIISLGLLFALFCLYGIGLEADLWSLATMIFGLALRHTIRKNKSILA